jgi:hypothetical protein
VRPLLLALLLGGCSLVHRAGKFNAPEAYVLPAPTEATHTEVTYESGFRDEPTRPYDPEPFREEWQRPVPITTTGVVRLEPPVGGEVAVWMRRPLIDDRGFVPVLARTGALHRVIPNELRIGWAAEDGEVTVPIEHLGNVFAGNPVRDGDLLLIRVDGPEMSPEDFLFRVRHFGLRTRMGAGVLIRVPIPGVEGQSADDVSSSPTLALSLAIGYRPQTRSPAVYWTTEQIGLVFSVGAGSTALEAIQDSTGDPVNTQLAGAFNAAITGAGLEFFRFVSVQGLANLSSFLRDGAETQFALAIGFDAVQFTVFTRDAVSRLLRRNTLDDPE